MVFVNKMQTSARCCPGCVEHSLSKGTLPGDCWKNRWQHGDTRDEQSAPGEHLEHVTVPWSPITSHVFQRLQQLQLGKDTADVVVLQIAVTSHFQLSSPICHCECTANGPHSLESFFKFPISGGIALIEFWCMSLGTAPT